jgi:hypothetical protein
MGHLYRYESLIGLSLFLTVTMLPFGCINEMFTSCYRLNMLLYIYKLHKVSHFRVCF